MLRTDHRARGWGCFCLTFAAVTWSHLVTGVAGDVPDAVHARAADVVRVQSGRSLGSGTYIGDRLVLTAAHVAGDASAVVTFRTAGAHAGRFVAIDRRWDLALVELHQQPAGVAGAPLARDNPRPGDPLVLGGYSAQRLLFRPGHCSGFKTNREGRLADWLTADNAVQPGDSGGPIFTAAGELVGAVWGSRPGESVGTVTGRTHAFLGPYLDRLDRWQLARQWCNPYGSGCGPVVAPRPTPPRPSPPAPSLSIDYERLAAEVAKLIPKPRDGVDGKPGPPGRDGTDGLPGPPGGAASLPDPLFRIRKIDQRTGQLIEVIEISPGESFDFLTSP